MRDVRYAGEKLQAEAEDAIFDITWRVIAAQQEFAASAPARLREYNRPINRLRRRVAFLRERARDTWHVLRNGPDDCGDW